MSEFSHPPKGEKKPQVLGVLLIGLGAFLLICLMSHSPLDPPNSSRSVAESLNWGGGIGAYASYGAFAGMGLAAYVWPMLLLLWGWNRVRCQPVASAVHRSMGLLLMAVLICVAAGLPGYSPQKAYELGGVLGTQISLEFLIPYLGRMGSAVLLCALFVAAVILTPGLNWRMLAWLGSGLAAVWRWLGCLRRLLPARHKNKSAKWERDQTAMVRKMRPEIGAEPRVEDAAPRKPMVEEVEAVEPRVQEPARVERRERKKKKEPKEPVVEDVAVPEPAPQPAGKPAPARKLASGRYEIPSTQLLDEVPASHSAVSKETLRENANILENALGNFDVACQVVKVSPGPVVTRYEVEPAPGVKVNRIAALSDDLARVMSAKGIRIQAPVPGKSVVGVEIANQERETVYLREILEDEVFSQSDSKLVMGLGKTISGEPCAADLAKMPHLLVAGATGAGKSVCLNSLICSILFKATPDEVRFIMVDPKVVELMMYNDIPHLLVPVITEPKKAAEALKWAVAEMESRYQRLAKLGVRNLSDYNAKLARSQTEAEEEGVEPEKPLAYLVIVIDEFADLMLTAPADVETSLMSLAQKSRAVGIHIILATQRPSVNVITGVIKANFPSRIAFQVASKTDSRTILDLNGAERLLGMGDMLFLPSGQGEPIRVHGAFISGEETERLVEALKESQYEAEEVAVFSEQPDINAVSDARDDLFDDAVRLVAEHRQASTSFLQRRLKVGYSRAGRLMDELEAAGIVGPIVGAKPREILIESAEEEYAEE
ncbi:MAG: DNA translocase FtsK [Gemmatimonadetes bacterium]|nr:DNA translocase FtsK [Gemmatimonadota bacterium]MDE2732877.1 DNA translocase FtsK [Gemmatimonadota bacterium]